MQQSSTNKDKKTQFFFLILSWLGFLFFFLEVRAFIEVVLKILAFSTSKAILFILPPHFTTHQTSNVLVFYHFI